MAEVLKSYGISADGKAMPISNPGADIAEDSLKLGGKPANEYLTMKLLWENASPASEFPPQNISFDTTGCSKIEIEFGHYQNETSMSEKCVIGLKTKLMANDVTSDTFRLFTRIVTTTTIGVSFDDAQAYSASDNYYVVDNNRCVPHRIYGYV